MVPGDYFDEMRLNPQISSETMDALRSQYGLDRPFVVRYVEWLGSVVRGNWGFSFAYGTPVAPLLWSRAQNTLILGSAALLIAWAIAIPAGVFWATTRKRTWDPIWAAGTAMLLSFPEVLWALIFLLFAAETGLLPLGGMWTLGASEQAIDRRMGDLAQHMVLPVLALVLPRLGVLVRHVRAAVAEIRGLPFVQAARAMGTPKSRLIVRHILPPAANPLITLFGLSIASLLSGSLIVEVVMGWPGLGPLLLEAILARDVYVVIGGVMCSAVLLVVGTAISDLLLSYNDPRIAWD
jgi:peptide/nickel transport system permease protein